MSILINTRYSIRKLKLTTILKVIKERVCETPTHVLRPNYVWWVVCGWMALSGLLVFAVQYMYMGKFSLPEGGFIIFSFSFLFFFAIVAGVDTYML